MRECERGMPVLVWARGAARGGGRGYGIVFGPCVSVFVSTTRTPGRLPCSFGTCHFQESLRKRS
jgi:hypothetical protein